jgi:ATP-binding cassette subfamily F protein 3
VGNYFDVVREIEIRREKENSKNARLAKEIQDKKDKSNFFRQKGGQMRMVAKRMREKAAELEEEMVDVRREDRTIREFVIPNQENIMGEIISLTSVTILARAKKTGVLKQSNKIVKISLKKGGHLLLRGPNGIGKTTLLESIANGSAKGAKIGDGVKVGYYRQDFSNLNFDKTVYQELISAMNKPDEEKMRSVASGFLINAEAMKTKIGSLSEGQKGLVAFARLVLEQPGLLILDEPTNHINFRHLPVIAKALHDYKGAMILVSHAPEFVKEVRIDDILDLEK